MIIDNMMKTLTAFEYNSPPLRQATSDTKVSRTAVTMMVVSRVDSIISVRNDVGISATQIRLCPSAAGEGGGSKTKEISMKVNG